MNTATFRTYLELLGLEHEWIANRLGVNVRSVERWCAPAKPGKREHTPPKMAADFILALVDKLTRYVDEAVDGVQAYRDEFGDAPESMDLRRYVTAQSFRIGEMAGAGFPHGFHNAVLRQIALALHEEGYRVDVDWVPVEP